MISLCFSPTPSLFLQVNDSCSSLVASGPWQVPFAFQGFPCSESPLWLYQFKPTHLNISVSLSISGSREERLVQGHRACCLFSSSQTIIRHEQTFLVSNGTLMCTPFLLEECQRLCDLQKIGLYLKLVLKKPRKFKNMEMAFGWLLMRALWP